MTSNSTILPSESSLIKSIPLMTFPSTVASNSNAKFKHSSMTLTPNQIDNAHSIMGDKSKSPRTNDNYEDDDDDDDDDPNLIDDIEENEPIPLPPATSTTKSPHRTRRPKSTKIVQDSAPKVTKNQNKNRTSIDSANGNAVNTAKKKEGQPRSKSHAGASSQIKREKGASVSPSAAVNELSESVDLSDWKCPSCNINNKSYDTTCAVCLMKRPAPRQTRSKVANQQ